MIYIDRFGNLITNIHTRNIDELSSDPDRRLKVMIKDKEAPLLNYYSQAKDKGLYSLINSFNYLELFIHRGNASLDFGIEVGEKVKVVLI